MPFETELAAELSRLSERLTAAAARAVETATAESAARCAALTAERDALRARIEELTAGRDALAQQVTDLTRQLTAFTTQVAELTAQVADLESARNTLHARADELTATNASLVAELTERAGAREAAEAAGNGAAGRREHRDELADHLAAIFDGIARSASVDEVLGAAANGLTSDFSRVVVLAVSNDKLEPRYQCGFEPGSEVEQMSVPVDGHSMLARAAADNELGLYSGDDFERPFGGSATLAVTAPIVVRGETLALIYADNDGQDDSVHAGSTPVRIADLLRQHASLRLDRLTLELKALEELRGYAKMLLDEVEYVYRADVSARKPEGERLDRLRENLRCARQMYQQRVATEGPAMASLLEEVVSATLAARGTSPFGRDLAAVSADAIPDAVEA